MNLNQFADIFAEDWQIPKPRNNMLDLVHHLKNIGMIKSTKVADVMSKVDRADFCPKDPYDDCP